MLTIWGGGTSRTMRAHWMASELDLTYTSELIGSRSGATQHEKFRELNLKEKIPVLTDGELVLTESAAIVTYLGDTYGQHSGLVPKPYSQQRAKYNEWLSFILMELDAHTLYVLRKHKDLTDLYGAAPAAVDEAIAGFRKQARFAIQQLQKTPYLLGENFSAADLILMTCLEWAIAYEVDLAPELEAHRVKIRQRPAYKAAGKHNFSIAPNENAENNSLSVL